MPVLPDPKLEIVARELSLGKSRQEALKEAEIPYSRKSRNDSRLFKRHPEIMERVKELQSRAAELAELNADWVLQKLKRFADGTIEPFLAKDESGKRKPGYDLSKASPAELSTLSEAAFDGPVCTKVKLESRMEAIKLIAVNVGMRTSNSGLTDGQGNDLFAGLADRLRGAISRVDQPAKAA